MGRNQSAPPLPLAVMTDQRNGRFKTKQGPSKAEAIGDQIKITAWLQR
jgi:hypothetical protein